MKLNEIISKNIAGLAVITALGCGSAQTNVRHETGLTVENYTLDYDDVPENVQIMLYVMDHNGENPTNRSQLAEYMWSPKDMNGNEVLDNHREVRITMKGNVVIEVYERFMTRTLTSATPELLSEATLTRKANGNYEQNIRNFNVVPDPEMLNLAIGNYRDGRFVRNLENTRRLLDSATITTPTGSRPMPNQMPRR